MSIVWNYDYTDEHGVGHRYPNLFGWYCDLHHRVCDPFTPVSRDYLLTQAATDPTLPDEVFITIAQAGEGRPIDLGVGRD